MIDILRNRLKETIEYKAIEMLHLPVNVRRRNEIEVSSDKWGDGTLCLTFSGRLKIYPEDIVERNNAEDMIRCSECDYKSFIVKPDDTGELKMYCQRCDKINGEVH